MAQVKKYTHSCLKCSTQYKDIDPDPYFCAECKKKKQEVAAEVDKKMAGRPKEQPKSMLQEYDEAEKVGGFMRVKL